MGKKHYSQSIKDEAVLFYELGHSFAETQVKYGMAESTFFTWTAAGDSKHPITVADKKSARIYVEFQEMQDGSDLI